MNPVGPPQAQQPGPYFAPPDKPEGEDGGDDGNNKRKAEQAGSPQQTQQRSKRNRYISIACNECKRRKIKCNGQNPCQRCGNLRLECIYAPNCCTSNFKDSEEFKAMSAHLQALQGQVDELYAHINGLRNGQPQFPMHPSLAQAEPAPSYRPVSSPSQSRASHPQYQGPTSSAFNLNVAKSSLQTMGITQPEIPDDAAPADIDPTLDAHQDRRKSVARGLRGPHDEPVRQLTRDDAVRLCRIYDEEMGMMYPVLDIEKVIRHCDIFFRPPSTARSSYEKDLGDQKLEVADENILKMVLASALMAEGGGESSLAKEIYESCRDAFERKLTGPIEVRGLILLVTVAEYHFQEDEEVYAYRVIGLATRLCLEMGLHRYQNLLKLFPNQNERDWAVKVFWSIYVLDRRWSFGTGIPFALQDADIDPALPEPDASAPYLTAMIDYSRISSKIWRSTISFETSPNDVNLENMRYLDYEILRWHANIPASLKFHPSEDFKPPLGVSRGQRRLHIILYLRTNQMRTVIYRPVLHSATTIMGNRQLAQTGVDVAKDTIRLLSRLHETTDIYATQQICFNYFLLSALAVIFLAVSHAPLEFSHQVRDEFYMALDIVKDFSRDSYVSKRLWKAIRGLKDVAPKLGLVDQKPLQQAAMPNSNDAHSSAAVAMAGLAGHAVSQSPTYASVPGGPASLSSPITGQQMKNELTSLFEAAKDPTNGPGSHAPMHGYTSSRDSKPVNIEVKNEPEVNEVQFARIIGDLFQQV